MGAQAPAGADTLISSLSDLQIGISQEVLSKVSPLGELCNLERLELLAHLKAAGLPLSQRQQVANALGSAKRHGRILLHPPPPTLPDMSDSGAGSSASATRLPCGKLKPAPGVTTVKLDAKQHCRIWVISDAHSDHPSNWEWIKTRLPRRAANAFDVCLCAGDVSDRMEVLSETLKVLKSRFDEVVFAAGNHDVWQKPKHILPPGHVNDPADPEARTSLDRLHEVHRMCESLGVHTQPLWLVADSIGGGGAGGDGGDGGEHAAADGSGGISDATSTRDLLLVPLSSWYHNSWDREPDLSGDEHGEDGFTRLWTDYHLCKWPDGIKNGSLALAEHFSRLNEPFLRQLCAHLPYPSAAGRPEPAVRLSKVETYAMYGETPRGGPGALWTSVDSSTFFTPRKVPRATQRLEGLSADDAAAARERAGDPGVTGGVAGGRPFIISLSHMVPRQELIPEKRMLLQPSLHKVSGSDPLEAQIRRLMPDVHVFGHTHLNMDLTLDGIRYVQWPLGTPREQKAQTRVSSFGLMCIYDGSSGGESAQHWTHWGRHYEEFERDLTKVARPPYVTAVTSSFSGPAKQARSTWGHEQSLQHAAGASSVGTNEISRAHLSRRGDEAR